MNIKRGAIYWITKNPHRPTAGSVQQPGRPGIVVSNDANNACSCTLEIVYLTGKPKKPLPTHCAIESTGKPSIALCEQVQTISVEQIREYIGHCTEEEMAEIDRCIAISLAAAKEQTQALRSLRPRRPKIWPSLSPNRKKRWLWPTLGLSCCSRCTTICWSSP